MKLTMTVLMCVCLTASVAVAGEMVKPITWEGEGDTTRIEHPGGGPLSRTVLTLPDPGVTKPAWAIVGTVRCQGVEGEGYLEMWSHVPGAGAAFSRTLGVEGPMGKLSGDQDWRPFVLLMQGQPGGPAPDKLVMNVVLPARGTVWLGPSRVVQGQHAHELVAMAAGGAAAGAWWTDTGAGWIGAIGGSFLGVLATFIGLACFLGRGRRLVLGALVAILALGAVLAAAGVVALMVSQPYAVFYPLLLLGGISLVVVLPLYPLARRRYAALELRKMRSMDTA